MLRRSQTLFVNIVTHACKWHSHFISFYVTKPDNNSPSLWKGNLSVEFLLGLFWNPMVWRSLGTNYQVTTVCYSHSDKASQDLGTCFLLKVPPCVTVRYILAWLGFKLQAKSFSSDVKVCSTIAHFPSKLRIK